MVNINLNLPVKRVGVIGYGQTGTRHIEALQEIHNAEICGIVGRNQLRLKQVALEKNVNYFFNLKTFYETVSPDYLVICLPILEVKAIVEEALQYPWAILVEKPLGLNHQENSDLLNKIKISRSKVHIGMNRRMLSSTLTLKKYLESHEGPRRIEIVDQQDTVMAKKIGFSEKVIENWHQANSIHMLDLGLNFTRGSLIDFQEYPVKNKVANEFRYLLKFDTGDILDYFSIWNKPGKWSAKIMAGQHIYQLKPIEKLKTLCGCCDSISMDFLSYVEPNHIKPGFYNQISAFIGNRLDLVNYMCTPEQSNFASRLLRQIHGS